MKLYIDDDEGTIELGVKEATLTFHFDGEMADRIIHWMENEPAITLRPFDREQMLREEFSD